MSPQLQNFDTELFLRDYWQRKPLFIPNPWASWSNPLDPDELAGLACDSDVESRLVACNEGGLTLDHGPLPQDRFGQLGQTRWTLLVQSVDQYVPQVAALIQPFRFIPDWRIDDVMVSYAADQGGVGPHFDQYDVFLVQGLGRRRWQVGQLCDATTRLLPHDDLRLLEKFEPTDEWILEPGDILYVPPRYAHDGVAVGDDCMTYSIGFRAPSRGELISAWCDEILPGLTDEDRYADPGLAAQENPGEISAQAIAKLHAMVLDKLRDRESFARAFGKHASTPRYPEVDWAPEEAIASEELRALLGQGEVLRRNAASRFSYIAQSPDLTLLFVDGECHECAGEDSTLARQLCAKVEIALGADLSNPALELIRRLYNQGSLTFDTGD